MHYISREARVGVVAGLAIFCFAFIAVFFRALKVSDQGDRYFVLFEDAGRVIPGTEVILAGVRVGEVNDVKLNPDNNLAQVEMTVDKKFRIYESYRFQVLKGTLIGQTAIEIHPIKGRLPGRIIKPDNLDQPIYGVSLPTVESVIPVINETLQTIQDTTTSMKEIITDPTIVSALRETAVDLRASARVMRETISDPRMAQRIRQALDNVALASNRAVRTAEGLTKLVDNVSSVLGESRSDVHATFAKLSSSANNLHVLTEKLKTKIDDPKLQARVDESLDSFQRTLKNFEESTVKIKELTSDPQMKQDLQLLLTQARESTENLREASDSFKQFASDPQIREDLKTAVHEGKETVITAKEAITNVRGATDEMKEAMKSARSAADRVNAILGGDSKSGGAKRSLKSALHPQMSFRHFSQTDQTLSDLSLRIGGNRSFFSTGLTGFGASGVSYSLQKGYGLDKNKAVRLGIFRSHPGIGFDTRLGRLSAAMDLYNPNRLRYAGWLGYEINPTFDFQLGIERGANRRDLIGAGLRVRPF